MGVLEQHCYVRAWIIDLRRCTKLFGVHHWKSSGRNRLIWHFVRKHCFDGLYYPTSPTARIPGCHGCCDHGFVNYWPTHRRGFHDKIDLEMVCAAVSTYLLSSILILLRCFFINLPVGALTILLTVWFLGTKRYGPLGVDSEEAEAKLSLREKLDRLDPIGSLFFLPGIVCLLLALEWGGSKYPWSNARIIVLFVVFGLLIIGFSIVQFWKQENATLPPRILKYRSVTAASFFAFCISGGMTLIVYFLPTWFQAIQGVDALESGIRTLPLIISLLVASIISGGLTSTIGYYTPFLILCAMVMAIGGGLMTTFKVHSPKAVWIGFQICFGFGIGLGQQQAGLAAQTVLPSKDVSTGVALKFFGQSLGGAIFVTVGQSVLSNKLVKNLTKISGLIESHPGFDPGQIVSLGALELKEYFGPQYSDAVILAFNNSLDSVFQVGMIVSCFALVGALLVEWKSIKGMKLKKPAPG